MSSEEESSDSSVESDGDLHCVPTLRLSVCAECDGVGSGGGDKVVVDNCGLMGGVSVSVVDVVVALASSLCFNCELVIGVLCVPLEIRDVCCCEDEELLARGAESVSFWAKGGEVEGQLE